jgi:hypothetical protein
VVTRTFVRTRIPCYTEVVANLTITVDDEVQKKARIRALEQGTSVGHPRCAWLARSPPWSRTIASKQGRLAQGNVGAALDQGRAL